MQADREVVNQFKRDKSESTPKNSRQHENTRKCQAFYAGDFMSYMGELGAQKQIVEFHLVKPYVNGVKGFMAQNRRKAKYNARMPMNEEQEAYTKYANSLHDYVRENANADQVETQQDGDLLVCGLGFVGTAMTYQMGQASTTMYGEILKGRIDPTTVGWDPRARATNLLDARYIYVCKKYALDDAITLFSAKEKDFETIDDQDEPEELFERRKVGRLYDVLAHSDDVEWSDKEKKEVKVYFYEWHEIEDYYKADNPVFNLNSQMAVAWAVAEIERIAAEYAEANPESGDLVSLDPRAPQLVFDAKIKSQLEEVFGEYIEPFKFLRKVFYTAVLSGNTLFTSYVSPSQQGFSIKAKTGDYDERNNIWVGMVNSMMEPVLYFCKGLTELMYTIASNSKGGVMYEEGAIEDIRAFERNYAKTNGNVMVASGAITNNRIKDKKIPYQPTGLDVIIQLSDKAISDVTGIDKTFLGSSENKLETAQLQRQRIRQVSAVLAPYLDAGTLYQKEDARLDLDYMRIFAENNQGAVFELIGEDGAVQFEQLSKDKLAAEYSVSIQEAPQTPDERIEQSQILMGIGDKLLSVGDVAKACGIFSVALKYLPLDSTDIKQLMELFSPSEKVDAAVVQQLQQVIQQLQSEATQSQIQLTQAQTRKANADTAKSLEEANQKNMETAIARKATTENISVNI